MAYYLTVRNNNNFKKINIENHPFFKRISKYKNDKYSLEEIDLFTSTFENELAFRESLYYNGIVDKDDIFKDISIRRKEKDQLIKVMYDPVYSDGKKYLDPIYLVYKIQILGTDYNFLNKLLTRYRNSHVNNEIIAYIRAFLLGNPELDLYDLLSKFTSREIYNIRYDVDSGMYEYTSVKYKSLHDLAMFAYNYEKSEILTKEDINEELKAFISYFECPKGEINSKNRVKKRTLDKQIEGQISFFD